MAQTKKRPAYLTFNKKKYFWKSTIDYRNNPHFYRVGRGEQGVLICEPYKSEILPYWRFKTPSEANISANEIYKMFREYLKEDDFVGADLARKFLQMGFTRSQRYANYKGGRKYDVKNNYSLFKKGTGEPAKRKSAKIFFRFWKKAEKNKKYAELKAAWMIIFG